MSLHDRAAAGLSTVPTPAADPQATLELLWSRVQERGDLPGFSKSVGAIVSAMRGDPDRDFNMTRTILSDDTLPSAESPHECGARDFAAS